MKTFSLRPWILSSSRWRQKPCSSRTWVLAGWLRAEERGARLTAATALQWDTCPWQPQELGGPAGPALCRGSAENSSPFWENKSTSCEESSVQTYSLWEESILTYASMWWLPASGFESQGHSTILWGASLRSLIALSFTRVDPRGLHLPDQGQR